MRVPAARNLPRAVAWTQLRTRLERLSPAELIRLLRDLHGHSAENRRFLEAALLDRRSAAVLDDYRRHILDQFAPTDPPRPPRLGPARKAIRDYGRATGDAAGAAELMLTYVEAGNAFSRAHGDMRTSYYHSLAAVLRDLAEVLRDTPALYAVLAPRLSALRRDSRRVGWTWGGDVAAILEPLEGELGRS